MEEVTVRSRSRVRGYRFCQMLAAIWPQLANSFRFFDALDTGEIDMAAFEKALRSLCDARALQKEYAHALILAVRVARASLEVSLASGKDNADGASSFRDIQRGQYKRTQLKAPETKPVKKAAPAPTAAAEGAGTDVDVDGPEAFEQEFLQWATILRDAILDRFPGKDSVGASFRHFVGGSSGRMGWQSFERAVHDLDGGFDGLQIESLRRWMDRSSGGLGYITMRDWRRAFSMDESKRERVRESRVSVPPLTRAARKPCSTGGQGSGAVHQEGSIRAPTDCIPLCRHRRRRLLGAR